MTLFNSVLQEIEDYGDGFLSSLSQKALSDQIIINVNGIWYISGNMKTIKERYVHLPAEVKPVPER